MTEGSHSKIVYTCYSWAH